jgi:hypothetical protein
MRRLKTEGLRRRRVTKAKRLKGYDMRKPEVSGRGRDGEGRQRRKADGKPK